MLVLKIRFNFFTTALEVLNFYNHFECVICLKCVKEIKIHHENSYLILLASIYLRNNDKQSIIFIFVFNYFCLYCHLCLDLNSAALASHPFPRLTAILHPLATELRHMARNPWLGRGPCLRFS